MNQKERMLSGLPYKPWLDGLSEDRMDARMKLFQYNQCPPWEREAMTTIIKNILGKTGKVIRVEPPFYCDYGYNIEVGENFYANFNLTVLDAGRVVVGDNFLAAPNVSIYTAGHPVHPQSRASGYEYGIGVTIGDNVWLGGNVVVNPGVRIGNNVVVGSGSVVTRDLPDNVLAAGNPCRMLREITEADRPFYFRERRFDVDDY